MEPVLYVGETSFNIHSFCLYVPESARHLNMCLIWSTWIDPLIAANSESHICLENLLNLCPDAQSVSEPVHLRLRPLFHYVVQTIIFLWHHWLPETVVRREDIKIGHHHVNARYIQWVWECGRNFWDCTCSMHTYTKDSKEPLKHSSYEPFALGNRIIPKSCAQELHSCSREECSSTSCLQLCVQGLLSQGLIPTQAESTSSLPLHLCIHRKSFPVQKPLCRGAGIC